MRQDVILNAYIERRITHPKNQAIGDKFQFFLSCLDMICHRTGEYYHYEVENHITLIDHLIFIADCTLEHPEVRNSYLRYCFLQIKYICETHPFFSSKDLLLNEQKEIKPQVEELIRKISQEPESTLIDNLSNVRSFLDELKKILNSAYPEFVVKCIYNKIVCKHALQTHKKDFEYLAKLLFSIYYLKGYSRNMISSFSRRILENTVEEEGKYIYTDAFLPIELYTKQIKNNRFGKSIDSELFKQIQDYLENRDQYQQIQAFNHILHYEKYEYHLIFRLEGLIITSDIKKKELDVLGLKISRIDDFKKKHSDFNFEMSRDFFENTPQSALVEIKSKAFSQDDAVYQALDELELKLGKIMSATQSRFHINRKHYTCFGKDMTDFWVNTNPEIAKIGFYSIEDLNKFESRIFNSPHCNFYTELEIILQKGYLEDDMTSAMHYFRKFIDILNGKIVTTGIVSNGGIPSQTFHLAYLLLYFEKNRYRNQIRLWAHNRLINTDYLANDSLSVSYSYRKKVRATNRLLSFRETLSYMSEKNLHTRYELTRAMNFDKQVDMNRALEYYIRQLLFIKQYRDKHEHANISNEMVARKLGVSTYRLLNQLLRDIFYEMDKPVNRKKEGGEILKAMILKMKAEVPI